MVCIGFGIPRNGTKHGRGGRLGSGNRAPIEIGVGGLSLFSCSSIRSGRPSLFEGACDLGCFGFGLATTAAEVLATELAAGKAGAFGGRRQYGA